MSGKDKSSTLKKVSQYDLIAKNMKPYLTINRTVSFWPVLMKACKDAGVAL